MRRQVELAAREGIRLEQDFEQPRARHAVDHAVMHLLEQRRAVSIETFQHVHLPQRARAGEGLREQRLDQLAHVVLTAR